MQINLEKKDSTYASLSVNLVETDFKTQVDEKIKEFGKKANIKGFRPGKVPASIVKSMVGEGIIAEEVYKVLNQSITSYLKENDLNIIGDPLPAEGESEKSIDWKNSTEFDFHYDIGIIPEFKYDAVDKIKCTTYDIEVEKKSLDETTDSLIKQHGSTEPVDVVALNDYVKGTVTSEDLGVNKEGVFITTEKIDAKEAKKLVGGKVGDKIEVDLKKGYGDDVNQLSYITGLSEEECQDLKGIFTITIEEITRNKDAEMNQEFFDKLFGPDAVKTEEEYQEKLKEIMVENFKRDGDVLLFQEIKEKIVKSSDLTLSADFLKRWLLTTNKEGLSLEQIEKDYSSYEDELKWNIIRNKLSEELEVKVEDAEVKEQAFEMVRQQYLGGAPVNPEMQEAFQKFVDNYLQEENGKNYMSTFEQVLTEKLFNVLKSKVTLKAKKVKSEEFKKIASK